MIDQTESDEVEMLPQRLQTVRYALKGKYEGKFLEVDPDGSNSREIANITAQIFDPVLGQRIFVGCADFRLANNLDGRVVVDSNLAISNVGNGWAPMGPLLDHLPDIAVHTEVARRGNIIRTGYPRGNDGFATKLFGRYGFRAILPDDKLVDWIMGNREFNPNEVHPKNLAFFSKKIW